MGNTPGEITEKLLAWFRAGHRDMPWRSDPTPYHVWLSEIMLQQTRVEAVRAYYDRFVKALPDIASLAACDETRLLKLWEGLGYYTRARNLKKAAQRIMEDHGGRMPDTEEALLALPGIGPYTAAAIASIAFHRRAAAVDGNVLRVMARLRADARDIAREETKRAVRNDLLADWLPAREEDCGDFNQALMELGAVVCAPNGAPDCARCPVAKACLAHARGQETRFPVKSAAKKRRIEARTVLLICDRSRIVLRRRPEKGLLAGLFEYPHLEGTWTIDALRGWLKEQAIAALRLKELPDAVHIFTHVEWRMTGVLIFVEEGQDLPETEAFRGAFFVARREIEETYAIPSAFHVYTEIARTLLT